MKIAHTPAQVRPERIFQTPKGRSCNSGTVASAPETPLEHVTLQGRSGKFQALRSLSGQSLNSMASQSALQAAAATSLPAAVTAAFTPVEFLMLNSGDYHNAQHPVNVGETAKSVAINAGRSAERAEFLGQVGLIHDADERILMDGHGGFSFKEGAAPARVPVTLAWMDVNQNALQERFGWNGNEFKEAKALIAGSEHPLNDKVGPNRSHNLPEFDGKSSKRVLADQLSALPAERRGEVLEEVQMLRFADQSAEYLNGNDQAREAVVGLSQEIGIPADGLVKNTPSFVAGLGQDNAAMGDLPQATGKELVNELGIEARVYTAEELHGFLSLAQQKALQGVKRGL